MTSLDITIVNVALPVMTANLHAPLNQVIWVVNAYLLIFAALAIPAGRVGDILGQRRIFVVGLVIFTVASALCGFSQDVFVLIGSRLLQGIGSACISATSLVLLTSVVPAEKRGQALGIYGSMVALAGIAGPVVGGWIIFALGWNWVFFVNIPISLLLLVSTLVFIPGVKIARQHHFDVPGIVFGAIAIFSIAFAIIEGPTYNWGTVIGPLNIAMFLGTGVIFLVLFSVWERFQREPFLPLSFFKNWYFASMIIANTLLSFAAFALLFLLTLYFEAALGMSPLVAGLSIAPYMLAVLIASPIVGRLVDKFGGRSVLLAGLICYALSLGILVRLSGTDSNWLTFIVPLALVGVTFASTVSSVMGEALRSVSPPMMGTASGIISTTRVAGGSLGIAVATGILQGQLFGSVKIQTVNVLQQIAPDQRQAFSDYLTSLVQNNASSHTALSAQLQHLAQQIYIESFVGGLHMALLFIAALVLIGALVVFSARYSVVVKKATQASSLPTK